VHVSYVAPEPERFGEVSDNLGDVIECKGEVSGIWSVAVSQAGLIGRDKVIAIGTPLQEWLEHPRRGGESVQQQKRRRVLGAGLSVKEDVELRFRLTPAVAPVLNQLLQLGQLDTLRLIGDSLLVGPARRRDASTEVDECFFRNSDVEGADFAMSHGVLGHSFPDHDDFLGTARRSCDIAG
jgi:hypothetical protein